MVQFSELNSNHIISHFRKLKVPSTIKITLESDAQFGDSFVGISQTDKRLVRATVKTFDSSSTYVFRKRFRKSESGGIISQPRIGPTSSDWEDLSAKTNLISCSQKESKVKRKPKYVKKDG